MPAKGDEEAANAHYLAPPSSDESQQEWLDKAFRFRKDALRTLQHSDANEEIGIYRRMDLAWMSKDFTCAMCMVYDTSLYDHSTNQYLIDSMLKDASKEFGGFDSIVLWHAYPRLGIDERNQFDFYRQLPGGLRGVRDLVERCHAQNVRVFIDYNPWDSGTRREDKPDHEVLADIVSAIDADGVFLDTLSEGSKGLFETLQKAKPGIALVSEGYPPLDQLAICNGSWAQWLETPATPAILRLKWIEPPHMQYQIRRWDRSRTQEIKTAFFNGSGMLVWENVFGTYNPWTASDRRLWKKANLLLRFFAERFTSLSSRPYYPSLQSSLYINYCPGSAYDLYVLCNSGDEVVDQELFRVFDGDDATVYDLWKGHDIKPASVDGSLVVRGSINQLGCILAVKQGQVVPRLSQLLHEIAEADSLPNGDSSYDSRNFVKSVTDPIASPPTPLASKENPPAGMVYVAGELNNYRLKAGRFEVS